MEIVIKKNYARRRRMSLPAAILILASLGRGVQTDKYQANAVRTGGAMNVDGRLDEADWKIAPAARDFIQTEPEEGKPATEATEVRILFDDRNIYFGVICHDSRPDRIVANEMRRDSELRNNDYFEVVLDTYNDHRNAFYFSVNPLGAQRDLLIRDEGANINREWDGIWVVRTQRTGDGWTAEIAIPFHTLRFNKDADQTWGVNFGRSVARKREESHWTPILRNYGFMGKLKISYFGHLTGLSGLKQGQKVQVVPYVIGGGNKEEAGAPFKGRADAGLDLKYRLTSNVTADLTVNTDFAQVESDQEQFNLTPYSLFFPEKREFFLEGADIFRFGERSREHEMPSTLLFFSRSIGLSEDGKEVPVLGGVKVTGKAGRYDLGVLDILTSRTSYLNDDDERVDIGRANSSVFRIKRDIFEKSSVGIIGLSKDPLDGGEYNRATGLDFNLAFGPSFKSDGFLAKTFSPDLKGNDWAGTLSTSFDDDFWDFGLSYTDIGENFNTELGFVPRTDIRKLRFNAGVGPRPRFLGLRQSFFMNNLTYIEDHSGRLRNRDLFSGVWNIFQNGSQLFFGYAQNFERLDEDFEIEENVIIPVGRYNFNSFLVRFNSDRSRDVALGAHINLGEFYNGRLASVQAESFLKVSRNFNLELQLSRNQFNLPVPGGKFAATIASGRFIYSFTPNLFAKAYVQWNGSEDLFKSNFLIRWIYKPGANVYFIYNETRKLVGGGAVEDRTVMLKVSFLFNL
jgi:hypothetical protein